MDDRSELEHRLDAAAKSRQPLINALSSVADAGGFSRQHDVAVWMARRLMSRIDAARNKKLRDWRVQRQIFEPWAAAVSKPREREDWICHLVKIEQLRLENEQLPTNEQASYETIIERACAMANGDLNPAGKRAVQLLRGARRKPSRRVKHPIEAQAIEIETRIKADWYPAATVGRPRGSMLDSHFKRSEVLDRNGDPLMDENGIPYKVVRSGDVRLTYEELVAVVLPSILNLGPSSRDLTVKIINVLTALAMKLEYDMASICDGHARELDEDRVYASLQEIAERYMRRRTLDFDDAERAQLETIGR